MDRPEPEAKSSPMCLRRCIHPTPLKKFGYSLLVPGNKRVFVLEAHLNDDLDTIFITLPIGQNLAKRMKANRGEFIFMSLGSSVLILARLGIDG